MMVVTVVMTVLVVTMVRMIVLVVVVTMVTVMTVVVVTMVTVMTVVTVVMMVLVLVVTVIMVVVVTTMVTVVTVIQRIHWAFSLCCAPFEASRPGKLNCARTHCTSATAPIFSEHTKVQRSFPNHPSAEEGPSRQNRLKQRGVGL